MERSIKVAVIGAGTASLVTDRELKREGHQVILFEKNNRIGGTWVYDPRVESDRLGMDPGREIVHSSMYHSVRVNLPRQLMGFLDYPFVKKETGDPRDFPGREEVLIFLNDFSSDFGLVELTRFEHDVVRVEQVDGRRNEWNVDCGVEDSGRAIGSRGL
uniref:Flavin-containing monooxygenase n=1 Tax=Quercus lobata TaxID=97700 RepID=A0A7N2LFY7_QUELO